MGASVCSPVYFSVVLFENNLRRCLNGRTTHEQYLLLSNTRLKDWMNRSKRESAFQKKLVSVIAERGLRHFTSDTSNTRIKSVKTVHVTELMKRIKTGGA